ncbi:MULTISPECIES: hypothetical protein [unclassified Bradyrhizobium]|uniref:hypothetical protein n=1 Tax=unclassified Bradyrhizobium TaxID=2631580 RepID=UPI003394A230
MLRRLAPRPVSGQETRIGILLDTATTGLIELGMVKFGYPRLVRSGRSRIGPFRGEGSRPQNYGVQDHHRPRRTGDPKTYSGFAHICAEPGRPQPNPREFTAPDALDKGYALLAETLWRMVTAPD